MNKAITDGLTLMLPPFSAGLNLWSREDGLPGQGSYAGQPNAAFVAADQDFGGCLEVQKALSVQKLRCFLNIPYLPGMYLRVTARIKAISGPLPSVRIAGYACASDGSNVTAAVQTGPSVALTSYGKVTTISAIIGSGSRRGVDMVWGITPAFGHLGLDLTGATGGVLRIDDIVVEDITEAFLRDMMDWVDVRDYGAKGDGRTDDIAAFLAADADAQGRVVLVSPGTYLIGNHLTMNSRVRFEGTLVMADALRLVCTRNFDLDTYVDAMGSETAGFRKALQGLFYFTDHIALDLRGRRIDLAGPIDVAALAGTTSFSSRRVITNGQFNAVESAAWATVSVTATATYSTASPTRLTGISNVAQIPVGARVSGTGVGREVYVTSRNIGAGTVDLSLPLFAAAGTRSFTFDRYQYMLDFSGFDNLARFEMDGVELVCNGQASGIMLARGGLIFQVENCIFNRPRDRGITSIGTGCSGLFVDRCQFWSNEQAIPAQNRTTIALNVNGSDAKIRDNRVVRFAHFAVVAGTGYMFIGNHFFQGDDYSVGTRRAGIVFTATHARSLVTGNYVDNCFLEWSNEHDASPSFDTGYSFSGLTIGNNIFMATGVGTSFRWLVLTPRGGGHFLNGVSISDNAFRSVGVTIDRVDGVDTTFAGLDYGRFRNVTMQGNTFHGVTQAAVNPLVMEHVQNTAADTWVVDTGGYLPFGARARNVTALMPEEAVTNANSAAQFVLPYSQVEQGTAQRAVNLRWPTAVKGRVNITICCDNPM